MLWYETHSTSVDNEEGIASGHSDSALSIRGEQQARDLGARRRHIKKVWCSDLQRSYRTAEMAFGSCANIHQDSRLREIDFGDLTRTPVAEIHATRSCYVDTPYPGGESYREVCNRVRDFLQDLRDPSEPQLIIGHRATWYALEHLLERRDLVQVISAPWRWQPGWLYRALFS